MIEPPELELSKSANDFRLAKHGSAGALGVTRRGVIDAMPWTVTTPEAAAPAVPLPVTVHGPPDWVTAPMTFEPAGRDPRMIDRRLPLRSMLSGSFVPST